ncbi:MAG: cytochrome C, partial [Alphaproteobacteria bacterium]
SKLIILDAKDAFSKQRLFENAWKALYPNLEWVSLSKGGKVTSVDVGAMTLVTDFDRHKADVANVIPPQKAGHIADIAAVADRTGWCPIDP